MQHQFHFIFAERRGKLVNFKVKNHLSPLAFQHSLSAGAGSYVLHMLHIKPLGVILFRVNIIAIATVNSEINLKTGSFPKNVFSYICYMIIQIFHQHFLLSIFLPQHKSKLISDKLPYLHYHIYVYIYI